MNSSTCQQVLAVLPWFVGDDLEEERRSAVCDHLRGCMACRREAAVLQRALGALGSAAIAQSAVVDESAFTDLHRSILARVDAATAVQAGHRSRLAARLSLAGVAAALVAVGFWLGMARPDADIWDRPPTRSSSSGDGPVLVVPYAGPRVELRPLGNEGDGWREDSGTAGSGLLVRRWLRTLVEEGAPLPAAPPQGQPVSSPR